MVLILVYLPVNVYHDINKLCIRRMFLEIKRDLLSEDLKLLEIEVHIVLSCEHCVYLSHMA